MRRTNIFILVILIVCYLTIFSLAQQSNNTNIGIDKYDIRFNGTTSRTVRFSPTRVMRLDNNGEILLACKIGKTHEQLISEGLNVLGSQLRLLLDWQLLKLEGDVYETTVPLLSENESTEFRNVVSTEAEKIASKISADLITFKEQLKAIGGEDYAFIILYAYVFHDLVFRKLKEESFYWQPELSKEKPFWDGTVYAIYPPPNFSFGTMAMREEGVQLHINSLGGEVGQRIRSMNEPFSNFQLLGSLISDIAKDKKVDSKNLQTIFAPYRIFNDQGVVTITIIYESENNEIFKVSTTLAEKYLELLLALVDSKKLKEELSVSEKQHAVLITFYELKWILLDRLVYEGIINKPAVLKDPEHITFPDIGSLIFMTEQPQ